MVFVTCDDTGQGIPHLAMDMEISEDNLDISSGQNCEGSPPNEKCWPINQPRGPTCLDKRKVLGLLKGQDEFVFVEAFIGQHIQLDCHYCNENEDDVPKIWYYNDRLFTSYEREIPQRLALPLEQRNFIIDEYHMLTIRNFSESEGAIYFCQGLHDNSSKFNFLIDVVSSKGGPEPISGNEKEYKKYYKEEVKPINKALAKEYSLEIQSWLKLKDGGNFNITYDWSPWGGCNVCGRDKGNKRRHGKCCLAIPVPQKEKNQTTRQRGPIKKLKFGIQFSCQSLLLDRFLSRKLVERIKKLSDFIENSKCIGTCLVDLTMIADQDWKETASEKSIQFETIWKTTEQSHTLLCPRSNLESEVVWVKGGSFISSKVLEKLNGRLSINVKNQLHFRDLRIDDKGNYTCFIDNVPSYAYDLQIAQKEIIIQDVSWVWTAIAIFSLVCFIIWIFLVFITGQVSKRIQHGYKPWTEEEKKDTRAFLNV